MNSKDKNFGKIDLKSVIKEESRIQKLKKNVSKASSSLKNKVLIYYLFINTIYNI